MSQLSGEYSCKIDDKGRVLLPAGLKKQLSPAAQEKFMATRGFESCITLYPMDDWQVITGILNKLNRLDKKNREFLRYFHRMSSELELDGTGRILIPKPLLQYASIEKELILAAYNNVIEVWNPQKFDDQTSEQPEHFADLGQMLSDKINLSGGGGIS
jgi:MraZ protein